MQRPLSRGRRALSLASSVFLIGVLALVFLWVPQHVRGIALAELTSVFGRTVTAGQIRLRLLPLELDIRDLRVAGLRPADLPSLEVDHLLLVPSVTWLWEGRIVLSRVHIDRPTVRIEAAGAGSDAATVPALGPLANAAGIRIRRLSIEGGALILEHRRIPLALDLPEVDARLGGRRGGLGGTVNLGPGTARFGEAPALPVAATFNVQWSGGTLIVDSGHVRADRSEFGVVGDLHVSATPRGHVQTDGLIDLQELDQHVLQTDFALAGTAQHKADIKIDGSQVSLTGHFEGHAGSWKGADVPRFAGDVSWKGGGFEIRRLSLEALGGSALLDLDIPPAGGPARVEGRLSRVDAEKAAARLFGIGVARVGAAVTGDVRLEWPRGRFREVSGHAHLVLDPQADGRTPVHGVFEWAAERGEQDLQRVDLEARDLQMSLRGRIARNESVDLQVRAHTDDLASSDELGERVRRALGNKAAQRFGISGRGSFDGHWRGTLGAPVYEGNFSGGSIQYLGVPWGYVEWSGTASERQIQSSSLTLRKYDAQLSLRGRVEPGGQPGHDAVDVHVSLARWPAEDLMRALDWKTDWKGPLSGEAEISGRRRSPHGRIRLTGNDGRYDLVSYDHLEVESVLEGERTEVRRGVAQLGGGSVQFAGTVTEDGVFDGTVAVSAVDVGALIPPLRPGVPWGGRLSGDLALQGTPAKPRVTAHLTAPRLFLGDEGFGALDAHARGEGDGMVSFDARLQSPRIDADLKGRVAMEAPYVADASVALRQTSLDPFFRASLSAETPGIVITGGASLRGPLARPLDLLVETAITDLQVLVPEYPVHSVGPLQLSLAQGRLTLRDVHLAGEGTNLAVGGQVAVLANGPLDLDVQGAADLRSLAAVTRRLRGRGDALLGLKLRGTRDAPTLTGQLELQGAGVRVRDFPHGLEDVRGVVQFTESAAQLKDVVGRLGGGEVTVDGQATYGRAGLASVDLSLSGRDIALRYPVGLRSVSNADLRVFGDGVSQWVTGNVDVRQAIWTRRYDVASELLTGEKPTEPEMPLHEGVRFDVTVSAPGTLRLDNNLGALEASADLRLQGTSDNPVLLGRAEIERGRVYFQGNTYIIRRGRIDFSNPQKLDPFFDIEAETRLRSYRVNLKMTGTLERVYPTLTSDPPLSAVQILSLLAGADEQNVASLTQAQADQARLAATGAASLAAGRLSEEFGLERNAERLFGLNRFSIDPSVLKNGVTNPTARLTVGKRLTPDLNVLYSVDLHGSDERLLSVEYVMSEIPQLAGVSILLTRSAPGGLGFDVRVQHSR